MFKRHKCPALNFPFEGFCQHDMADDVADVAATIDDLFEQFVKVARY